MLILHDPLAEVGTVEVLEDGASVTHVEPERYYKAQLGSVMNVLAVFLNLNAESGLSAQRLAAVDDAIAAEYWNRYQGCLLPRRVLRAFKRAMDEKPNDFAALMEKARAEILSREVSLDAAAKRRIQWRIDLLMRGAGDHLGDLQTAVGEALVDVFLLERAAMEDVLRAEADRSAGQPRCDMIDRLDKDRALAFERTLPLLIKPNVIADAIPADQMAMVQRFAAKRTPFYLKGLFR